MSALFARRLDMLEDLLREAADADDPYEGLRDYVLGLADLQSRDIGMWLAGGDQQVAPADDPSAVRQRLQPLVQRLVTRARATGRLREDFGETDVIMMTWTAGAISRGLGEVEPQIWKRYLSAMLDGFSSPDAAPRPLPVPALAPERMEAVVRGWGRGGAGR